MVKPNRAVARFDADIKLSVIPLLFILAIAGIIVYTALSVRQQQMNATALEMAGRQRLLIHQHLQEVLFASQGMKIDYQYTRTILLETNRALLDGGTVVRRLNRNETVTLPRAQTPEMRKKLQEQEAALQKFIRSADLLLALGPGDARQAGLLKELVRLRDEVHQSTGDITQILAKNSEAKITNMLKLEIAVGILVALLGILLTRAVRSAKRQLDTEMTERRNAEEALLRLERAVQETQIGVTITDTDGNILFVNPADAAMHGYEVDELIGKNVRLFASPELWEINSVELMKDMQSWRRESVNMRKDGTVLPVQLMSNVVKNAEGEPIGVVTTCEDITERKRAEQALTESEARFRSVAESAPDAIVLLDSYGRIVFLNKSAESIFKYRDHELLGQPIAILIPPDLREAYLEGFQQMQTTGVSELAGKRLEATGLRKDGSSFPLEFSVGSWETTDGVFFTVVIHDITKRKQTEQQAREANERYRELVETARDIIFTLSRDGIITSLNPAFEKVTGWRTEDWIGKKFLNLISPDSRAHIDEIAERVLAGETFPVGEVKISSKSGATMVLEYTIVPEQRDEGIVEVFGVARDITARKQVEQELKQYREQLEKLVEERTSELSEANDSLRREVQERERVEKALRESEQRYALAVRGAKDGLWDWDLRNNTIFFSQSWKGMLGYEENEIEANPDEWFSRIHPEDVERVKVQIFSHLEGLMPHFETEYRMSTKNGSYRWVLSRGLAVRDGSGKAYRIAGFQRDIGQRKRVETELTRRAFYDPLTNLPNRALFMDRLGQSIKRANRRRDYLFALLYVDLDRFKEINDTFGHLVGDQLLVAISRKLEACLRPGDTVARLGGDEFTILLDDIKDLEDATHIAERIWNELKLALQLSGREVQISASIGIALGSYEYSEPADVIRDADKAMYRAKQQGRARHEVYNATLFPQK